jgi:hypothetical protein
MSTSEARIRANQQNAALSTGPKTDAGKEKSRRNSLKHGLTGSGVVLLEGDAAEVARRTSIYADELGAMGEVGEALARLAALNSVRLERAADQQAAALGRHVRQVEAEFVAPEGADEEEIEQLRAEAARIAMFDPSKEAVLARKYEGAAERSFYRALKQLRQMELHTETLLKAENAENPGAQMDAMLGSILAAKREGDQIDAALDAMEARLDMSSRRVSAKSTQFTPTHEVVDVPMTIGRSN